MIVKSRLAYFGILLTCPKCGAEYSPLIYSCPACSHRISELDRDMVLKREKSKRIAAMLKVGEEVYPGQMYYALYRRIERQYKIAALKPEFSEEVLTALIRDNFVAWDTNGYYVLRKPTADEVYSILWGEKSLSTKEVKRRHERQRKHAECITAVMNKKEGDYWAQVKEGRINPGCVTKRFLSINSNEGMREAIKITRQNSNLNYNFFFVNGFRPTQKRIDYLISEVTNIGIVACSEWTWLKRLRLGLSEWVKILMRPRGGVKRWTSDIVIYVRSQLEIGEKFGTICKNLNLFNIKISIKGIMKYHWKEIKRPPPIFI